MALSIGIVGLPNVGKSTLFNSLTKAQNAMAANYPFCTIEPNKAIVNVPDSRLTKISSIVNPKQIVNAVIEFTDIAGLVKGASKGEGLGNQFLSHIRETAAIIQVVRCFENDNIIHVENSIDPIRDINIINTELILADIQSLEKKITRIEKNARTDKKAEAVMNMAKELVEHLNNGNMAITFSKYDDDSFEELMTELRLITAKKIIYAANVDEDSLEADNDFVKRLREFAAMNNAETVKICAKIEEEMIEMADDEKMDFLKSLGADESGLDQVIKKGYSLLGLSSYFTAGPKEVKAWTIPVGSKAPKAAAVIHTDFEKGFIRAEVISYNDYIQYNGEAGARNNGKLRVEGKEYIVQDGDVMHFLFNV